MAIRSGRFGYSFTVLRILQFLCCAAIAGLCVFFAAEVNRLDGPQQPTPVVLALAFSIVLAIYALIAVLTHLCHPIPYITNTIADATATIVLILTAVYVGRPLTRLDCAVVGDSNEHIDSLGDVMFSVTGSEPDGIHRFIAGAKDKFRKIMGIQGMESVDGLDALGTTGEDVRRKLGDYSQWVGRVESTCRMMKAVWGLTLLLIFLFTASAIISFILYRRVYSIRTFHVEEDEDGDHIYYTQHVPAAIMREDSVKSYDRVPNAADDDRESLESVRHSLVVAPQEPGTVARVAL